MARSPTIPLLLGALLSLGAAPLAAQTAPAGGAVNIPPVQSGGEVLPPVEILAQTSGSSVRCEPAEARLPASDQIDLRIVNRGDQRLTFEAPSLFKDPGMIRHSGDIAKPASGQGFTISPGGIGRILVSTPQPGQYPFTCTGARGEGEPFQGTLTIVPSAG